MKGKNMVARVTEAVSYTGEPIGKQPLVELCGANRVLVEHHMGIGEYSTESIRVKVRFGAILVEGEKLDICKMTAEQLVIIGNINGISLMKGQ